MKKKLTKVLVRKAQPQDRAYLIWDTQQSGFALKVEKSGYRSFYCIYRFGGRVRWYKIGAVTAIALPKARKLAADTMLALAAGKDPQADRLAARSSGTFADSLRWQ